MFFGVTEQKIIGNLADSAEWIAKALIANNAPIRKVLKSRIQGI